MTDVSGGVSGSAGFTDDAALVGRIVAGSDDAIAAAYDRHAQAVYAAAFRLVGDRVIAEDVVQETFLALWNRAETFDAARGSLATWLTTVARHRAVDRLRAAGRRPRTIALGGVGPTGEGEDPDALERLLATAAGTPTVGDPEAAFAAVELRETLARALATMSDPEREVIALAYRDELTQSEIAARLGWPLGTVKTRTRRALYRLRSALAEIAPDLAPRTEVLDVDA
jgi:RNA polymerase sigma-70 factor (ECF subfamily)